MATSRTTGGTVPGAAEAASDEPLKLGSRVAKAALGSAVTGVRLALPLMNAYSRAKGPDESITEGEQTKLSDDERMVIGTTVSKLVYEGAAIIAAKHPVEAEMPLRDDSGQYPPLNLGHAVSAATAVYEVLDRRKVARAAELEKKQKLEAEEAKSELQALNAPAPPMPAMQIRRNAMMKSRNQHTATRSMTVQSYRSQTGASMAGASTCGGCGQMYMAPMGPASNGCGCGQGYAMQPVEASESSKDSKECDVEFFSISCETQKRLKACIKGAVCELLWSMDGVLCPDGKPADFKNVDTGALLTEAVGTFACSLVRCVPEALCPPSTQQCAPAPTDPLCNFAVEE